MEFTVEIPFSDIRSQLSGEDIFDLFYISAEDALEHARTQLDDCEILTEFDVKSLLDYLIEAPNAGEDWIKDQLKMLKPAFLWFSDAGLHPDLLEELKGKPQKQAQILSQMLDMLKGAL